MRVPESNSLSVHCGPAHFLPHRKVPASGQELQRLYSAAARISGGSGFTILVFLSNTLTLSKHPCPQYPSSGLQPPTSQWERFYLLKPSSPSPSRFPAPKPRKLFLTSRRCQRTLVIECTSNVIDELSQCIPLVAVPTHNQPRLALELRV